MAFALRADDSQTTCTDLFVLALRCIKIIDYVRTVLNPLAQRELSWASQLTIVLSLDGTQAVRAAVKGTVTAPADAGRQAAAQLLQQGAGGILAEVTRAHAAVEGIQP